MSKNEPIVFNASVAKISTVAAGGYRIFVDVPETDMVGVMSLFPGVQKTVFKVSMTAQDEA